MAIVCETTVGAVRADSAKTAIDLRFIKFKRRVVWMPLALTSDMERAGPRLLPIAHAASTVCPRLSVFAPDNSDRMHAVNKKFNGLGGKYR